MHTLETIEVMREGRIVKKKDGTMNQFVVIIVVCIISGTISYTFLSIFSFSSDAILQSFLLDEELRF